MTTTTTVVKRGYGAISGNPLIAAAEQQRARAAFMSYKRRNTRAATGKLPYQMQARIYGRPSNIEVKCFDQRVAASVLTTIAATGYTEPAAFAGYTCLNEVQQGATAYNRIGSKITMKSISLRAQFYTGTPATDLGVIRCMLVYDRQTNAAAPTLASILSDNVSTAPAFSSGINISNKNRYQILRDQFFNVDPAQGENHYVNLYCKGRWVAEYGSNAGNVGDIQTGAVFFIAFQLMVTGNCACQSIQSRIRYFD